MSSSSDNGRSDDSNPFIAFRRLIDDQVVSMVKALNEQAGLPPGSRRGEAQDPENRNRSQAPDESESRLFGIFSQPSLYERAICRRREQKSEESDPPHTVTLCPAAGMMKPAEEPLKDRDPSAYRPMTDFEVWKHTSPYSPFRLHQDPDAPEYMDPYWHRAFLDLLASHNGQPMTRVEDIKPVVDFRSLVDATRDFQHSSDSRGSIWSELWHGIHSTRQPPIEEQPMQHKSSRESIFPTEEDMYRWFLGQQDAQKEDKVVDSMARTIAEKEQRDASSVVDLVSSAKRSQDLAEAAHDSAIISMLTTTHTTTNADGSSRTVRRFKKTFADGREEAREDVLETPAQQTAETFIPAPVQNQKKSGWFWN